MVETMNFGIIEVLEGIKSNYEIKPGIINYFKNKEIKKVRLVLNKTIKVAYNIDSLIFEEGVDPSKYDEQIVLEYLSKQCDTYKVKNGLKKEVQSFFI